MFRMPFRALASRGAAVSILIGAIAAPTGPSVAATLTLDEALRLTRESNRRVAASRIGARAAAERAPDAGRRPNPEISASAENFGGGRGGELLETTVAITQAFELGGDRAARSGAAAADAEAARLETGRVSLEQEALTSERFLDAWALQEKAVLLREAVAQAREAVAAADERHRAGAAPAFERVRAETYLATREMERRRAEAALGVGIRRLALQWDGAADEIDSLALAEPDSVPSADPAALLARLASHPDRLRAEAEIRSSEWRARAARAARVPDLSIGAGVRRLSEPGVTAFTLEVSAPLPLWNGGRGTAAAAEAEREAAGATARAVEADLAERALAAHDDLRAAWEAHRSVRDGIVPGAEEALRMMRGGYLAGRLGYLEILDGQRSVLEANLLLVETHADVWRARTNLERMTGGMPASEEERR